MKIKTTFALSVVLFGIAWAASAGSSWSVSIGFGGPAYYPAPVMVAPSYCPPPRIMVAPPVVYCPPRPVCPPPRCGPPGYAWGHYKHGSGYNYYGHDDRRGHRRDWEAGCR